MVNRNSKKFIKKKSKKSKRTRRIKGGQGGHTFAKAPTGRLPIEGDNRMLASFLHEAGLSTRGHGRHIYDGLIRLGVNRVEDIDVLEPEDFEQVGITPSQQKILYSHLTKIKGIPRGQAPLLDEGLHVEDSIISRSDRKIQESLDSSQEPVQIIREYINGLKRELESKQRSTEILLASAEIELARCQERMNKLESELELERKKLRELTIKYRADTDASFGRVLDHPFLKAAAKWAGPSQVIQNDTK